MPPRQGGPRAGGGPCPGLRSCPPAFLALTSVTVDELPRLVPPCEVALPAQKACGDALHHCRMHLRRWPLIVNPTTSLECFDQICTRRIAAFRVQATKGSGFLHP